MCVMTLIACDRTLSLYTALYISDRMTMSVQCRKICLLLLIE